jgi:hypothetical protein
MAGENTYLEHDGKSIDVKLSYTTPALQVALVEGWLGITVESGDSGEEVALLQDDRVYQFTVPAALTVAKGDTVYITIASVTGTHIPPDGAYSTTSGAGKVALFKAVEAKNPTTHVVCGKLIGR